MKLVMTVGSYANWRARITTQAFKSNNLWLFITTYIQCIKMIYIYIISGVLFLRYAPADSGCLLLYIRHIWDAVCGVWEDSTSTEEEQLISCIMIHWSIFNNVLCDFVFCKARTVNSQSWSIMVQCKLGHLLTESLWLPATNVYNGTYIIACIFCCV